MHHRDARGLRQYLSDTAQALIGHLLTGHYRDRLRCFAQRKWQFSRRTGLTRGVGMAVLSGAAQPEPRDAGGLQLQLRSVGGQRIEYPDPIGTFGGRQTTALEQLHQALSHLITPLECWRLLAFNQGRVIGQGNIGLLGETV